MKEALGIGDRHVRTRVHQFPIFKDNRQNKYRMNFLAQHVCSSETSSHLMWSGREHWMSSNLDIAHFAISPLLYDDHRETWDAREGLNAGSPHVGAAGSCSAEHRTS